MATSEKFINFLNFLILLTWKSWKLSNIAISRISKCKDVPDVKDNPFCKNDVLETVQFDLKVKDIDDLLKLNENINIFHSTVSCYTHLELRTLTHFILRVPSYITWKIRWYRTFLMFSLGIERDQWHVC